MNYLESRRIAEREIIERSEWLDECRQLLDAVTGASQTFTFATPSAELEFLTTMQDAYRKCAECPP